MILALLVSIANAADLRVTNFNDRPMIDYGFVRGSRSRVAIEFGKDPTFTWPYDLAIRCEIVP